VALVRRTGSPITRISVVLMAAKTTVGTCPLSGRLNRGRRSHSCGVNLKVEAASRALHLSKSVR
jgi:hypothetical protein